MVPTRVHGRYPRMSYGDRLLELDKTGAYYTPQGEYENIRGILGLVLSV